MEEIESENALEHLPALFHGQAPRLTSLAFTAFTCFRGITFLNLRQLHISKQDMRSIGALRAMLDLLDSVGPRLEDLMMSFIRYGFPLIEASLTDYANRVHLPRLRRLTFTSMPFSIAAILLMFLGIQRSHHEQGFAFTCEAYEEAGGPLVYQAFSILCSTSRGIFLTTGAHQWLRIKLDTDMLVDRCSITMADEKRASRLVDFKNGGGNLEDLSVWNSQVATAEELWIECSQASTGTSFDGLLRPVLLRAVNAQAIYLDIDDFAFVEVVSWPSFADIAPTLTELHLKIPETDMEELKIWWEMVKDCVELREEYDRPLERLHIYPTSQSFRDPRALEGQLQYEDWLTKTQQEASRLSCVAFHPVDSWPAMRLPSVCTTPEGSWEWLAWD